MTLPVSWPPTNSTSPLAVLCSGGLDSAILLSEALLVYPAVHPVYIRTGAQWESVEFEYLTRFLAAVHTSTLRPVVVLEMPVADLYGKHWSLAGDVPDAHSADEAVFLPGRNVILLSKALIWCHLNNVPELATAPLGSNPFPDATDEFYDRFANIVSAAVTGSVRVLRPYATAKLHKLDVLKRGATIPLQHTFSCIQPIRGLHCGRCNKCAERKHGFSDANMTDPTEYAS